MEVAVCVGLDEFFSFSQFECGGRGILRGEVLYLAAAAGFDKDPFDVVLGGHRMLDASYFDGYCVAGYCCDRDVFFLSRVGGSGDKLCHVLAAAYQRAATVFKYLDDVAAQIAFEKSHDIPSSQHKYLLLLPV